MRVWSASSPRSANGRAKPLVAMCPVSLRAPGDHGGHDQGGHAVRAAGPPALGRAPHRLRQVVAQHAGCQARVRRTLARRPRSTTRLLAFGLWFASNTLGLGAITRPVINLVVSNVGGVDGTALPRRVPAGGRVPGVDARRPRRAQRHRAVGRWPHGLRHRGECRGAGRCVRARAGLRGCIRCSCARAVRAPARPRKRAAPSPPSASLRTFRKPPARTPSRTRRMPASQRS